MPVHNQNPYSNNLSYTKFLDQQGPFDFQKYADQIVKYTNKDSLILDVGCGTGIALELLRHYGREGVGIEVSKYSLERCADRDLKCQLYDGKKIPFKDGWFDLVGSYNVLEHVDNPLEFLEEQLRILRGNGILIVVCPNFLSITNSYHYRTRGVVRKVRNFFMILQKLFSKKINFEKMEVVVRENFSPDDDACNVTNPIDVFKWADRQKLKLEYWSSRPIYKKGIVNLLDRFILRLFFGGLFMVFRKV